MHNGAKRRRLLYVCSECGRSCWAVLPVDVHSAVWRSVVLAARRSGFSMFPSCRSLAGSANLLLRDCSVTGRSNRPKGQNSQSQPRQTALRAVGGHLSPLTNHLPPGIAPDEGCVAIPALLPVDLLLRSGLRAGTPPCWRRCGQSSFRG